MLLFIVLLFLGLQGTTSEDPTLPPDWTSSSFTLQSTTSNPKGNIIVTEPDTKDEEDDDDDVDPDDGDGDDDDDDDDDDGDGEVDNTKKDKQAEKQKKKERREKRKRKREKRRQKKKEKEEKKARKKVEMPTCDCWTAECGYCTNPDCTVKLDLYTSQRGIEVHSPAPKGKKYDTVVLYDKDGAIVGRFQWNMKGIYLSGCAQCQTPIALRKARVQGGPFVSWTFSLTGGLVRITMNNKVLYEQPLLGECFDRYRQVKSFAFYDSDCDNSFYYQPTEMEKGKRITMDCAFSCVVG